MTLDDVFQNEAKSLLEENERDLRDEQQNYDFVASIDIFCNHYNDFEQKIKKCIKIERQLDIMPYISRHSDVYIYYPDVPDKKPAWLSDFNHNRLSTTNILLSGLHIKFVFGFSGNFSTSNERMHLLWWLRYYCSSNGLCKIEMINDFNIIKSFSYNDCGDLGLALNAPGSEGIKQRYVSTTNFKKRVEQLEKDINEFFEPSVTTWNFETTNLYATSFDSVSVFDPEKIFIMSLTV